MDNPHLNRIVLNGGPKDGELLELPEEVAKSGYFKVPIVPDINVFRMAVIDNPDIINLPMRTGMYRRDRKSAGTYNTCEFRVWYEWHWMGEN